MKVYHILRNADMTEGRGPMTSDNKIFLCLENAKAYVDQQIGVMGRRRKWSEEEYGDWEIHAVDVMDPDGVNLEKKFKVNVTSISYGTKQMRVREFDTREDAEAFMNEYNNKFGTIAEAAHKS